MTEGDNDNGRSGVFPTAASRELMVAALQSDGAAELFRRALDAHDPHARALQSFLADNPEQALAALEQDRVKLALSSKGASDALEIILGDMPVERARKLLEEQLTPKRRAELIQGRGDLPAVAAHVASLDDVIRAVLDDIRAVATESALAAQALKEDLEEEQLAEDADVLEPPEPDSDNRVSEPSESSEEEQNAEDDEPLDEEDDAGRPSFTDIGGGADVVALEVLRAWALKLCDRPDYDEFLNMEIGHHPIRRHLILALALDARTRDVPASSYDELGLDPDDAREELRALLASGQIPTFDPEAVERARKRLMLRRRELEETPATSSQETIAEKEHKLDDL